MSTTTSLAEVARRDLPELSDGIVGPGDAGYDDARAVHNGMIDKHPALIARCAGATDVMRAVTFAREHQLLVLSPRARPEFTPTTQFPSSDALCSQE